MDVFGFLNAKIGIIVGQQWCWVVKLFTSFEHP
jgi:hypothetical protein